MKTENKIMKFTKEQCEAQLRSFETAFQNTKYADQKKFNTEKIAFWKSEIASISKEEMVYVSQHESGDFSENGCLGKYIPKSQLKNYRFSEEGENDDISVSEESMAQWGY